MAMLAHPAVAEKADRDKPVNLEADRVTIDDAKKTAIFEGNVVLTQGTLQIRGNRMEVRQDQEGFRQGTTWGTPAFFRQKREGFAQTMQMFNRAQLKRGHDEVSGNFISYDGRTEFFQVIGGGAQAAAPDNPEGRVRAVIQPKPKEPPPASPPVGLKPSDAIAVPREEQPRTRRK
jgi:lipopolysaccharide export system protein LptA